jgi:hypothetical protein
MAGNTTNEDRETIMDKDNIKAESNKVELLVPPIDAGREAVRRGGEMVEAAIARINELLAAGVRLRRGSTPRAARPLVNESDGRDGTGLLAA